ncbi:MAG TPA: Gfo/Idh/MocA family oxidoreductase [Armatimonadetes bacterium]|nr:Gfo/Idh/MocA family oxidoreductase [Armatimonadota bacterium]
MLESAIVGCGPRAREHAVAYERVQEARLVAACDIDAGRLEAFANAFDLEQRFTDAEQMLNSLHIDLVHIVTPPTVRVELISLAAEKGVRGIICEKPIALRPSELQRITEVCERHEVRLVINHQKRLASAWERLRQIAQEELGPVHLLSGSSGLNLMEQGTHLIDQILSITGERPPTHLLAHVWGPEGYERSHAAPANAVLLLWWEDGLRAHLEFGQMAPHLEGEPNWAWYQLAAYGENGCAWVQLNRSLRWWHRDGLAENPHPWAETNREGQARLTQVMVDWLLGRCDDHPCALRWGRVSFEIIMAAYRSALEERILSFPTECTDAHWYALRSKVRQTAP